MSDSLWPHGLQHARLPCPSLHPSVYSDSCPLSRWCYLTISSSAALFSFCLRKSNKVTLSSVQSLSHVRLFAPPWTAALQASLSFTNSWSLPKLTSSESVMPSSHLILCYPPSPPALNLSQHQGIFKWVNPSYQVVKVLEFQLQHQSFQWTPRTDLL